MRPVTRYVFLTCITIALIVGIVLGINDMTVQGVTTTRYGGQNVGSADCYTAFFIAGFLLFSWLIVELDEWKIKKIRKKQVRKPLIRKHQKNGR